MLICSALHTLCLLCLKMLHLCLFKPEHCSFQVMLFHMLFMPKYAERKASRMDKSLPEPLFLYGSMALLSYIISIPLDYVLQCLMFCYVWWLCMVIDISVQYNGGFLPDIILLTQGYYHRGTRLNTRVWFCL